MDAPDPEKERVPSGRLRSFLTKLISWSKTNTPLAGEGIRIDEHPGKGTMISMDGVGTMPILVCVDGSPVTVNFLVRK